MHFLLLISLFKLITAYTATKQTIVMTEVFKIPISPSLFNWTYEESVHQYVYQPSLLNAPDLPLWINFIYSKKHHSGYLYGVPPKLENHTISLQIIGLNKKNYETKSAVIDIHVTEKLNPAKYEVHMKIDNVNIDDVFDGERMDKLRDVFKKHLWKESEKDLYITFLASAIQLGARKPLKPNEGEGIVLRLGSQAPYSVELTELQEEIKPLWKVPSCPFKRTSVERYFREAGFTLDWCSFRLIDDNNSAMHQAGIVEMPPRTSLPNVWEPVRKDQVPTRSYSREFTITCVLPIFLSIFLTVVLSAILCYNYVGMNEDQNSEDFFANLFHICTDTFSDKIVDDEVINDSQYMTIQRATESLRNFANNRDASLSPEPMLISQSPNSTISRGIHCRPSPPPYVKPKFKPNF